MEMWSALRDLWNYYTYYPFWWFHAVIAIWAARSLWVCHADLREIEQKAERADPLGEVDPDREMEKAASLLPVFDLYSNSFILIGLVGTIYGFYAGLTGLERGQSFQPRILAPALATSLAGIALALILNFLTRWVLERRVNKLVYSFAMHARPHSVADAVRQVGERYEESVEEIKKTVETLQLGLEKIFEGGTENFAEASKKLTESARLLSETVGTSATQFQQSIKAAAKTSARLDEVLGKATDLPARITQELQAFSDRHAESVGKLSTDLEQRFASATETMTTAITGSTGEVRALRDEFTQFIQDALTRYAQALQDVSDQHAKQATLAANCLCQVLEETRSLPAAVGAELMKVSQDQEARFREALVAYRDELRGLVGSVAETIAQTRDLPAAVGATLQDLTAKFRKRLEDQLAADLKQMDDATKKVVLEAQQTLHGQAEDLRQKAEAFVKSHEKLYDQEAETVSGKFKELFVKVQALVDALGQDVKKALQLAPGQVREEAEAVRNQMIELAATLGRCADELRGSAGQVQESLSSLETHTGALHIAAGELRQAAEKFNATGPIQVSDRRLYDQLASLERIKDTLDRAMGEGLPIRRRPVRREDAAPKPGWKERLKQFWKKKAA